MTQSELRNLFPHTRNQLYVNHAAVGPLSTRVMDSLQSYYEQRHRSKIDNFYDCEPIAVETLQMFADTIAAPASQVEFVPNTSYGLGIIAEGIDWRPGDRIAIPGCEFPANVYPFLNLRYRGVSVDFIPHTEATISLEDVERTLRPETRLLSISWVQFLSGFRSDLAAIVRLCHDRDILVCVDAIQGLGALQLNVADIDIDFLSTGAHKWLMAEQGIGCIYAADRALEQIRPAAGWLHGPVDWDNFFDYKLEFHPDARRFRRGTMNNAGVVSLHAALGLYLECGTKWCEQRIQDNARFLLERLTDLGLEPYGRAEQGDGFSGIVTFRTENAEQLAQFLERRKVIASVRNGMIRFAPSYYNTIDEMAELVSHVQAYLEKEAIAK